jgi:hypothetical protein
MGRNTKWRRRGDKIDEGEEEDRNLEIERGGG